MLLMKDMSVVFYGDSDQMLSTILQFSHKFLPTISPLKAILPVTPINTQYTNDLKCVLN